MLPGGTLSSYTFQGVFTGGRNIQTSGPHIDFENGGIALNDNSAGRDYQVWRAEVIEDKVWLQAANGEPILILEGEGITEISFTFDQNMRLALAYVQDKIAYFRWYDTSIGMEVTTVLGDRILTPRVCMDDKRLTQTAVSDIILAYVRNRSLRYKLQRDRYEIEYTLIGTKKRLIKIGMTKGLRVQFLMTN